jgi:predicted nuclease of restriction endonuclease-like (RecB) superfamily
MFPKLSIQRSQIAVFDKPVKSKTNLAIIDRRINPPAFDYSLNWTHIQRIMRVSNTEARSWYLREAAAQSWDVRTLDRNISTQYYERLLMSQAKKPVIQEMRSKTGRYQKNKLEFIKNPSVLEFLGLPGNMGYSEAILEKAIINHLQQFILELGKGFAFVERQQLIRTETSDYYIDMVFYNYILKCFVLIDLKTSRITHQDVGQMDMYVRMYDELKRNEGDNPTIGILLCSETDKDIARYSILKGNEHLFATKYKLYLPTEEELRIELEKEKEFIRLQLEDNKS